MIFLTRINGEQKQLIAVDAWSIIKITPHIDDPDRCYVWTDGGFDPELIAHAVVDVANSVEAAKSDE